MTSKTSSNNFRKEFKQTFLWELKNRWSLIVLFCGLHFVALPLIEILALNHGQRMSLQNDYIVDLNDRFFNVLQVALPFLTVSLSLLLALILPVLMYSYMHQKRSVDLFHALPVSRTALLSARMLAGLTVIVIPLVLNFAITGLIGVFYQINIAHYLPYMIYSLGWIVLMSLAAFLFCTVLAVCSGTTFDMVISTVVLNITYPLMIILVMVTAGMIIPGMTFEPNFTAFYISALAPFCAAYIPIAQMSIGTPETSPVFLAWWLIFCVIMVVASLYLYRNRKSECAESNAAFPIPKILIRFVATTAAGLVCAQIFLSALSTNSSFFVGLAAGSLIAHIVAEAVYGRGFKGLKKSFAYYGIFLLAFVAFYGICVTGAFGYDTRIPKEEDVSYVEANLGYTYGHQVNGFAVMDEQGRKEIAQIPQKLEEPENIKKVLNCHSEIINVIRSAKYPYEIQDEYTDMTLIYHLKNGTTIKRVYSSNFLMNHLNEAENKKFQQTVNTIMSTAEYRISGNPLYYLTPEFVESIAISLPEQEEQILVPDRQKMQELIDTLKKDEEQISYAMHSAIQAQPSEENDEPNDIVWLTFRTRPAVVPEGSPLQKAIGNYSGKVTFFANGFSLDKRYTNTRKLIEENGWTKKFVSSTETVPSASTVAATSDNNLQIALAY
ncbi:ABC transporter permease [Clostridium minihomine]|uniref:ABC transporter permease n=1 Tax=Clostridium minihomine TaxID=2045012 RepID=UPI000C777E74|nr:ABC transporter permease [Clostridium minihomine]